MKARKETVRRAAGSGSRSRRRRMVLATGGAVLAAAVFAVFWARGGGSAQMSASGQVRVASDALRQRTMELVGYAGSIQLTPEQQRVKIAALEGIPAACGRRNTLDVRCCSCNLGKTVSGLANTLIAGEHADVARVRQAVVDWLDETNPQGYAGDACDRHRCDRPFRQDGCGGMAEAKIVF